MGHQYLSLLEETDDGWNHISDENTHLPVRIIYERVVKRELVKLEPYASSGYAAKVAAV